MDSEYLKKHVGDALTRGLVEISQKRPHDPIEYLALWLRKYVENREYDKKKKEELIQLAIEREEYRVEMERQRAMEEEQRLIAQQEALERALQEPVVVDDTPRPMPKELTESLPTLTEGDEEEKKAETGIEGEGGATTSSDSLKEAASAETTGTSEERPTEEAVDEAAKEPDPEVNEEKEES